MKNRMRVIFMLLFASFFIQAQISNKKQDSELKQINNMVTEAKSVADQVFLDDLIVSGSACIGQDCVNGESFGFDTIRLKENNLRIKALDTSSSASFPTNDWQITFNDSANGGKNKFSIDDVDGGRTPFTIEAGAPSHSLYVDNAGRIGFGTTTPVVEIHSVNGDSPTLRLEQSISSGFGAQTWDLAGNESNFFIRDATNGSNLPFRIRPKSPSSSIDIFPTGVGIRTSTPDGLLDVAHAANANNHAFLISPTSNVGVNIDNGFLPTGLFDVQTTGGVSRFTVKENGKVGLGITNPGTALHIADSIPIITLEKTGTGANKWRFGALENHLFIADETGGKTPFLIEPTALDSAFIITSDGLNIKNLDVRSKAHFRSDVYVKGSIFPSASFGPSDERLKTNFEVLNNATNILKSLYPKSFYFRSEFVKELGLPSEKQYGLIAQDVEKLLPELVKEFETSSGKKYKSVNYTELIPFLIQGFKEQQLKIVQLEGQISHYASLESRLEKLEKYSNKTSNAKR
jgi:hypothetical protein